MDTVKRDLDTRFLPAFVASGVRAFVASGSRARPARAGPARRGLGRAGGGVDGAIS